MATQSLGSGEAPISELSARLRQVAAATRARNPDWADAIERFIRRLRQAGAGSAAPQVGETMPDFVLPDETGRLVSLADLLDGRPLAITFQRGHWCPYCRAAASVVSAVDWQIVEAGGRMASILPERQDFARAFKAQAGLTWPVLTDMDDGYALSLGLAIALPDDIKRIYQEIGFDLPRYQGSDLWMLPIPATFVLDGGGVIVARHLDPDYRQRMELADLLDAFRAASGITPPPALPAGSQPAAG